MMRLYDTITWEPVDGTAQTLKARLYRGQSTLAQDEQGVLAVSETLQLLFEPGPELSQGDKITHHGKVFYVQGDYVTHYVKGKAHHCTAKLQTHV